MTEQEYNLMVEQCIELIDDKNLMAASDILERLSKIKPVRLSWYVAKAKYTWECFHTVDVSLADKSSLLFPYPGLQEMNKFYIDLVSSCQDIPDMQRHKLLYIGLCGDEAKEAEWVKEMNQCFQQAKKDFMEEPEASKTAEQLLNFYFIFNNYVMFYLLWGYMQRKNMPVLAGREWFLDFINSGFLQENLLEGVKTPFVIIDDENSDGLDEQIMVYILRQFQKRIYQIKPPIPIEVEHAVDMEETVEASIGTMKVEEELYTIYPALLICGDKILGDNREYILAYLNQEYIKQFAVIFTSGILMNNLCCQPVLKKNLERLYHVMIPPLEKYMVFGWTGDYLGYISQIHVANAEKLLKQPTECSYSIIVPARNSAQTLRYTLMSCLNQRYQGDYEVVLSDNSAPGNTEVYQLYKELDDSRIKYYRTPREYNLSRSFEFAFLHARGEFLLSLGSDDALLPWTLEVLDDLRKTYPDEEVIQWERGFYAWPGFNGGQQHQFVIPRNYQKNNLCPEYLTQQFYFGSIFNNSDQMYLLPNLYLNSGCRREYLKTILRKTGRLFDGICQDIYMGVVNAAINEKILNIHYPLSIAGMSSGSMGAKANMVYELKEDEAGFLNDLKKTANIGGYCASPYERLMPEVTTDKSSLYNCILRLIARGVIAESDLEHFDFRRWFLDVFSQMDIRDPLFDKKVHVFRYTASLHGEEFLKWFDETIYSKAFILREIDEEKVAKIQQKKCYKEGTDSYGGRTLDASKYDVHNVYDAALLFERLSGL